MSTKIGDIITVKHCNRIGIISDIYNDLYLVDYFDSNFQPNRRDYAYCTENDFNLENVIEETIIEYLRTFDSSALTHR